MQKIIILLFFLLGIFNIQNVSGEVFNGPANLSLKFYDALSINGPANLKMVKAQSLEIKGTLQFHRLSVAGKADIKGSITGDYGQFGLLNVLGSLEVDHVICDDLIVKGAINAQYLDVKNQANIEGLLNVQHGKFKNITVKADKITLDEVIVDTIIVSKNQSNQVLVLKGKTVINGDIIFESGTGLVQAEGSDVLIKGSVTGAKLSK